MESVVIGLVVAVIILVVIVGLFVLGYIVSPAGLRRTFEDDDERE